MFQKPYQPIVTDRVEERTDIGISHRVDPSLPQPEGERVQRVVLAASGPESLVEFLKLSLVDRRQNRHHRRLDDLILQCGDAERSQPAIRLQSLPTTRGQSPLRARMDAFVKIP